MELDFFIIIYTKVDHEWITDLNVRAKATKLLEESFGGNLHDLALGKASLDMTAKA